MVVAGRAGHNRLSGERGHQDRRDPDRDNNEQPDTDVVLDAAPAPAATSFTWVNSNELIVRQCLSGIKGFVVNPQASTLGWNSKFQPQADDPAADAP